MVVAPHGESPKYRHRSGRGVNAGTAGAAASPGVRIDAAARGTRALRLTARVCQYRSNMFQAAAMPQCKKSMATMLRGNHTERS